jgi:hypothetical protein
MLIGIVIFLLFANSIMLPFGCLVLFVCIVVTFVIMPISVGVGIGDGRLEVGYWSEQISEFKGSSLDGEYKMHNRISYFIECDMDLSYRI